MRIAKITAYVAAALLAASCSLLRECPDNLGDEVVLGLYGDDALLPADTTSLADIGWREFFKDEPLCQLISLALDNNSDLNTARQRVVEAQAALKAAQWAFFPAVSVSPSYSFSYSQPRYSGSAQSYSVPVGASWEADLSGSLLARKRKAAVAVQQSETLERSIRTEIVATVAEYYYTLLKLDAQLEISRTTAASWKENVRIMKAMKEAGMTNEASVSQTEANACSIEASLFDLVYQLEECENALWAFVGVPPQDLGRSPLSSIVVPESLVGEVPVKLLSRRADVEAAELDLRLAYYDTAAAQAAFYPSLNITGNLGWDKAITSPAGWLVQLGAGVAQPLFARGSLKAGLTTAQARQQEAAIAFRQILLRAGSEVSNALALCSSAQGKTDVRIRQIAALESAVVSTRELMRHSESTYLEVLTAQQSLLSARLLQVSDRYDLLRGSVSLYRALGGGAEE